MSKSLNLNISHLLNGYKKKIFTPSPITKSVIQNIEFSENKDNVWIHRLPNQDILQRAEYLESIYNDNDNDMDSFFMKYPLYGIPFAIKDNMNIKDLPTTCGCPGYKYIANETAECVQNILLFGGILIGKTNLDQFATGLNGTRTAYGTPVNPYNNRLIPGGSSSGSAVAVSSNLVSFSLGTDTAGSGRVPAALNNIYGIKPSKNVISTNGIIPACKSLDCTSIFAHNISDAYTVLKSIKNRDKELCHTLNTNNIKDKINRFKFGIPAQILDEKYMDKYFMRDCEYFNCFRNTIGKILDTYPESECIEIDFEPFFEVANLLYNGPWLAERLCALPFIANDAICNNMNGLNETVRNIISSASELTAKQCFDSFYKLEEMRKEIESCMWNKLDLDFLCVPSIPTTYNIEQVIANPIELNSNLGLYTNFVNLLDLCAVAMPIHIIKGNDGERPFGCTLIGENMNDLNVMLYAAMINEEEIEFTDTTSPYKICVCGAHLSGFELNYQFVERGAKLFKRVKSQKNLYEMYSIDNNKKPGLVKQENDKNIEIDMEIWCFQNKTNYSDFIAKCVNDPLCIGTIYLNDNTKCKGFLMEPYAINHNTPNITQFGNWENYKKSIDTNSN